MSAGRWAPRAPYRGLMMHGSETRFLADGRTYDTRAEVCAAARRAERRTGWVLCEILDATPQPRAGDAHGWDDYRLARGIGGAS